MHPDNNFNAEILFPKSSTEAKIILATSVITAIPQKKIDKYRNNSIPSGNTMSYRNHYSVR